MEGTDRSLVSRWATDGQAGNVIFHQYLLNRTAALLYFCFPTCRKECANAGVHIAIFAGIAGNSEHGAYSVVLSGAYEDDEDMGETL